MKKGLSQRRMTQNGLYRYLLWHTSAIPPQKVLIAEFPRSGGTWLASMLSDLLDIEFPRNQLPPLGKSILHGHFSYSPTYYKPICLIRDGRDVMVSAYYHFLFSNAAKPIFLTQKWQSKMPFTDYGNIQANLPSFMEIFATEYQVARTSSNWATFYTSYYRKNNTCWINYEDLQRKPTITLQKVLDHLNERDITEERIATIVEKHSFYNYTARKSGQEVANAFHRKGIIGDWKNVFTDKSKDVFKQIFGDALIQFGYEENGSW